MLTIWFPLWFPCTEGVARDHPVVAHTACIAGMETTGTHEITSTADPLRQRRRRGTWDTCKTLLRQAALGYLISARTPTQVPNAIRQPASIRNKLMPTPPTLRFAVAYCRCQPLTLIYPFRYALTSPPIFYVPGQSPTSVLLRVFNEECRK